LCELKKLEELDLSYNHIEGILPPCLSNLTSLRLFDVSGNQFMGNHLSSLLGSLNSLEYINLRHNHFEGLFSFSSFVNHSKLEVVAITSDNDKFEVETKYKDWLPMFQLKVFVLPNCNLNKRSGDFPKFLLHQNTLSFIDLSHNNLEDDFKLTQIEYLRLNDNQFTGPLTNVVFNLSKLSMLDISNNNMSGTLTSCSNPNLGVVVHVHLQGNHFTKFIPEALINLLKLVTLDVSDNNLSGSIPLSIRLLANRSILILRGNQLGGSIPTQLCQLNKISLMDLSNNSFTGSIPSCLSNITFGAIGATDLAFVQTPLEFYSTRHIFYVYENVLLPHLDMVFEIGGPDGTYDKVDEVEFITKSRTNSYRAGSILNFMSGLDLSCNKLTGEIPFELGNISSVRALNLSHNLLIGPFLKTFSNLTQIESLDLSYNNLSGNIPTDLINLNFLAVFIVAHNNLSGKLSSVRALNLSHNLLIGPIPKTFSNLTQIESLDLSYNNLSGNIPTELISLNFLEVFIVAHNNLSGKLLDRKAQFATFEASSYEGNPFLCGPPLEKNCTPIVNLPYWPITLSSDETEGKWYDIDLVAFSASFVGSYIAFLFGFAIILYINPYWRQMWFYLIEEGMYSSYYFISDTVRKIF
ncbi:receptor-like protein 56, partial [Camellia sinensis]|uniref:receptor-like protein 56 n=1 Tax=Camellia sinensis TaxID=4442 RepID=UPI0010369FC2